MGRKEMERIVALERRLAELTEKGPMTNQTETPNLTPRVVALENKINAIENQMRAFNQQMAPTLAEIQEGVNGCKTEITALKRRTTTLENKKKK